MTSGTYHVAVDGPDSSVIKVVEAPDLSVVYCGGVGYVGSS